MDEKDTSATMRAKLLAKEAGVSVATIYNRAKELGRFPTVEEAQAKKTGRKSKYK